MAYALRMEFILWFFLEDMSFLPPPSFLQPQTTNHHTNHHEPMTIKCNLVIFTHLLWKLCISSTEKVCLSHEQSLFDVHPIYLSSTSYVNIFMTEIKSNLMTFTLFLTLNLYKTIWHLTVNGSILFEKHYWKAVSNRKSKLWTYCGTASMHCKKVNMLRGFHFTTHKNPVAIHVSFAILSNQSFVCGLLC